MCKKKMYFFHISHSTVYQLLGWTWCPQYWGSTDSLSYIKPQFSQQGSLRVNTPKGKARFLATHIALMKRLLFAENESPPYFISKVKAVATLSGNKMPSEESSPWCPRNRMPRANGRHERSSQDKGCIAWKMKRWAVQAWKLAQEHQEAGGAVWLTANVHLKVGWKGRSAWEKG